MTPPPPLEQLIRTRISTFLLWGVTIINSCLWEVITIIINLCLGLQLSLSVSTFATPRILKLCYVYPLLLRHTCDENKQNIAIHNAQGYKKSKVLGMRKCPFPQFQYLTLRTRILHIICAAFYDMFVSCYIEVITS